MPHYFFKADYGDGRWAVDYAGQEFESLEEAQAHAAVVAEELGRNAERRVTVEVLDGPCRRTFGPVPQDGGEA